MFKYFNGPVIVDTDFEERGSRNKYYMDGIIEVYGGRKLNIAYNLGLFIIWYSKIPKPRLDNEYFSIQEIIDSSKRNCPRQSMQMMLKSIYY
jgi:hypothetical protein